MVGSSELGGTENEDLYLHYQIEEGKDGAAPMKALWCGRLTLDEAKHISGSKEGQACRTDDEDLMHQDCNPPSGSEPKYDYLGYVVEEISMLCRDGKCQKVQCQALVPEYWEKSPAEEQAARITADCPKKSYCNLANVADMFENWDEIPPNYCKTGEEQKEKEGSKCTDNDNCENDLICMSEGIGTWHTDKYGEQTYTDEKGEVQKWEEICKHPGKTGETCMADEGESSCETGLMCTPKK